MLCTSLFPPLFELLLSSLIFTFHDGSRFFLLFFFLAFFSFSFPSFFFFFFFFQTAALEIFSSVYNPTTQV